MICTANICRSPMAEHLLRMSLDCAGSVVADAPATGGTRFDVSSAGVRGWTDAEMDPPAAGELRRLGADPAAFRARTFTPALARRADLILTATRDHRRFVLEAAPEALRKTFTLLEFASLVSSVDAVREASGDPAEVVRRAASHRGAARMQAYDLADPYGQPAEAQRQMAQLVDNSADTIATALATKGEDSPLPDMRR